MRLLLIEPSNLHATRIDRLPVPPLALGVLAALSPAEWEVKILQEADERVDLDYDADLVGITAGTTNVLRGYQIADAFRKRGIPVIMGGIHPTVLPSEARGHCDAVCIGEAELIWRTVLQDCMAGKLQRIYRQERFTEMDAVPRPRRDLLSRHRPFMLDVATIETARGCPYACEFCSASTVYGRRIRERSMESLLPEIEETKSRNLFFVDNNILTNVERTKRLFREMAPLKKRWAAQASLSFAEDHELVDLAAHSGCFGLFIGLESVADVGAASYRKNPGSTAEMRDRLRLLRDHGITVHGSLVFGNDFETGDSIRRSLDVLKTLDIVSATFGILTPLPGTVIAERLEAQGRILSRDWSIYDLNHLVFQPRNIACESFISEMRSARREFFSPRAMGARAARSAASFPLALAFNMAIRSHHDIGRAPVLAGGPSTTAECAAPGHAPDDPHGQDDAPLPRGPSKEDGPPVSMPVVNP